MRKRRAKLSSDDEDDSYSSSPELESLDISNDHYYQPAPGFKPRVEEVQELFDIPKYGSKTIQHSLPAYDLWRPFFPTYLSEEKFRNFHRPKLRHYNTGPQAPKGFKRRVKPFPIKNLTRNICSFQKKLRYRVIRAIVAGLSREEIVNKYLLIKNAKDLTAKHGELFLFEYCEEFPPVLSQIGMAANVKTLTQHQGRGPLINKSSTLANKNVASPMPPSNTQPKEKEKRVNQILSQNNSNSCNTSTLKVPLTNTNLKMGFEEILTAGNTTKQVYYNQLKPGSKLQVIENNMFRAPIYEHEFQSCDFLLIRTRNNLYIRPVRTIFTVGQTMPIVAIPEPTEGAITKFRLDLSNRYIHKLFLESNTTPPTMNLNHLLQLFPDYSSTTFLKRIKRRGVLYNRSNGSCFRGSSNYGLVSLKELRSSITPEQYCLNMAMLSARQRLRELNYTESMIRPINDVEVETEVRAAPWNTSKAVLRALTGKNYLDFKNHLIDPTGPQREGFSCIPWSKSPTEDQQAADQAKSKPVQLPTNELPFKNPLIDKIRREKLERLAIFQREAQIISEVQSKVLSSNENLSSDEDMSDDDLDEESILDQSFDEQLKDLDKMLVEGRTMDELSLEKEEEERIQMIKELNGNVELTDKSKVQAAGTNSTNVNEYKNKFLKIIRTYESDEGPIQRTEVVRDSKIIALYIKYKEGQNNHIQKPPYSSQTGDDINSSPKLTQSSFRERRPSTSLGPSELCRAEGIVVTISKTVLNIRAMRMRKRDLRAGIS